MKSTCIREGLSLRHVIRKDYYPVKDFLSSCAPKETWHEYVILLQTEYILNIASKQESYLLMGMTFVS